MKTIHPTIKENKMKLLKSTLVATICMFMLSGCYHVQVNTGKAPSDTVIDIPFATSLINGLVPPKVVETAEDCPAGVALVESKLSFVNLLVGAVTLGIYTPMHITVTCADDGMAELPENTPRSLTLSTEQTADERVKAFSQAAIEAANANESFLVIVE